MNLEFKHHGTMNLKRLKDYVSARDKSGSATLPDFNFNPLVNHLNTVIFKSLSKDVFSTSSHRFYFKNGHELLDNSRSLCIMRGYDYKVKSAMEKVSLNVNAATSAFFRPITIAEFLVDYTTFATNEVGKRIKRLKVYIVPDRKASKTPRSKSVSIT
jgi:eukaryotic translation initiation factor 2C